MPSVQVHETHPAVFYEPPNLATSPGLAAPPWICRAQSPLGIQWMKILTDLNMSEPMAISSGRVAHLGVDMAGPSR